MKNAQDTQPGFWKEMTTRKILKIKALRDEITELRLVIKKQELELNAINLEMHTLKSQQLCNQDVISNRFSNFN